MTSSPRPSEQNERRYPGVRSFGDTEVDRHLFFGRDLEKYELLQLVLVERLVVLFSRSGLGKSSIINAGLMQPLRNCGRFPMVVRISSEKLDPLDSFYRGVKAACDLGIERGEIDAYEPANTGEWNKTSLWHFIKTFYIWRGERLLKPVVIIDQFEELFTIIADDRRGHFINELADLVRGNRPDRSATNLNDDKSDLSDRPPEVKVVLAIREEFMARSLSAIRFLKDARRRIG